MREAAQRLKQRFEAFVLAATGQYGELRLKDVLQRRAQMRLPDDDRDLLELRDALCCGDHRGIGPLQATDLVQELLRLRAELRILRAVEDAAMRVRLTSPVVIQVDPEAAEMQLRPEVAALIALSFAVFIERAHTWVSVGPRGIREGAVAAALHRFKLDIDAIFQQGGAEVINART